MAEDQEFEHEDIELPDLNEVLEGLCESAGVEGVFVMRMNGEVLDSAGDTTRAHRIPLVNPDADAPEDDWAGRTTVFNLAGGTPDLPALALLTIQTEGDWYVMGVVFDRAAVALDTLRLSVRREFEDLSLALEDADDAPSSSVDGEHLTGMQVAEIVEKGFTQLVLRHVDETYAAPLENILDNIDAIAKDPGDTSYVEAYLPELSAALDQFQEGVATDDTAVMNAVADLTSYTTSLTPDALAQHGLAQLRTRMRTLLNACTHP